MPRNTCRQRKLTQLWLSREYRWFNMVAYTQTDSPGAARTGGGSLIATTALSLQADALVLVNNLLAKNLPCSSSRCCRVSTSSHQKDRTKLRCTTSAAWRPRRQSTEFAWFPDTTHRQTCHNAMSSFLRTLQRGTTRIRPPSAAALREAIDQYLPPAEPTAASFLLWVHAGRRTDIRTDTVSLHITKHPNRPFYGHSTGQPALAGVDARY